MNGDAYFYARAEVELRMAQRASSPPAVRAHYELANRYLDRFYNPEADDHSLTVRPPRPS